MASGKSPDDFDLETRRRRLSEKLDRHAPATREPAAQQGSKGADYSKALRLSSEFIAAILVGAALGWGIDRFAGTAPWGMIILLLLGFAAGVMNVMRTSGVMTSEAGSEGGAGPIEKDG